MRGVESQVKKVRDKLIGLPRRWKRALVVAADCAGVAAAVVMVAFIHALSLPELLVPWWQVPAVAVVVLVCAKVFRLYSSVIRYIALRVAYQIAQAALSTVAVLYVLQLAAPAPLLEPHVLLNLGFVIFVGLGTSRLLARHFLGRVSDYDADRIIIYGAGEAGVQATYGLTADRRCLVVAFLDDRKDLVGTEVAGLPVYCPESLSWLIEDKGVKTVLLAMPSASRTRKQAVIEWLEPYPVMVKTIPGLQDILSGKAKISEIRDIEIEDLLGRDPVPPDEGLMVRSITGRSVLVTGAGGSIGSELCRQIVQLKPRRLVLFDANESGLYEIERELRAALPAETELAPVLGNVLDRGLVDACMRRFEIQTIYHAAAYKHVPLVEQNVSAGLRNNVFGTWNVAEAALVYGVERFILVSTDKAVRPTNVMGASKRVAELVVQAMAGLAASTNGGGPRCIFSMVRFGNVLGSSGSVVPQFRGQINAGGPMTVTHPEITRYFMTIPEAAQLVIQAGAMARGGEVFVLDMGQPIRILDLATRMIRLAGLTVRDDDTPDGDIGIAFTGLRPGEKLYEELLIGENSLATGHPKIGCAQEDALAWSELKPLLERMDKASEAYQRGMIKRLLKETVAEYDVADDEHDLLAVDG